MPEKNKLQQLADDKIAAGLPPADAYEVAQRQIEHDDRLEQEAVEAAAKATKTAKGKPSTPAADTK